MSPKTSTSAFGPCDPRDPKHPESRRGSLCCPRHRFYLRPLTPVTCPLGPDIQRTYQPFSCTRINTPDSIRLELTDQRKRRALRSKQSEFQNARRFQISLGDAVESVKRQQVHNRGYHAHDSVAPD